MKSKVLANTTILVLVVSATYLLGKSTIDVRVLDQNGNPLKKVEVFLYSMKQQKTQDEKTDKVGVASFDKLDDDYYRVWARHQGFGPAFRELIKLSGEAKSIDLPLEPGDPAKKLYFEDVLVDQQANQLLQEGGQALEAQQFDQAEEKFKQALALNPSQPVTYQHLGVLSFHQRKWELAEEYLKKAETLFAIFLEIDPTSRTLPQQLEQIRQMVAFLPIQKIATEADEALRQNRFDEAAAKLRQLAEMQPNNAGVFYNLTLALARGNKIDEAREAIDMAIQLDPENQSFKDTRAELDKLEEAAKAQHAKELLSQVDELLQAAQYEQALSKAGEIRQDISEEYQPILYIATARANVKLERPDDASAAYRKAIEMVPDKIEYRRELADYLLELERYDEAFGVFREVWELSSEPLDESLFKLGQDLIKRGKQDMARKAFEQVVEANPDYAEAYYELGMEYFYGLEDRPKAVEMLKKYVKIGKDEAHLNNAKSVIVVIEKGH